MKKSYQYTGDYCPECGEFVECEVELEHHILEYPDNLYDEMRMKVLKAAYEKYNLDELMKKLDIKYNEF